MDFSNRQNRFVTLSEISADYLAEIKYKTKSDPFYPSYHIAPHHGLINDPNGLSYFAGEHHIFYQWFPLGPVHGLKHWYHVSTKDFVSYTDHGIAMYPDQDYDQHGCYTGVGIVENEELHLFYTGNKLLSPERSHPTQCYAVMSQSGEIKKKGVVVDYDTNNYTFNFRDPAIFTRCSDYYMLVGAESKNGNKGCLALYSGKNIDDYHYVGNVDIGLEDFGFMWECPNYYEEKGKGVFIFSPQGVSSENKYDLKNVFSVVYMVGQPIDTGDLKFESETYIELDKGFDFYAPQTYLDDQERRILIGWLGNSKSEYPTDKNMWAHMLTLPRVLTIDDNKLCQTPLKEIESLRESTHPLGGVNSLHSTAFELELEVESDFSISLSNEEGEEVTFAGSPSEFILDRTNMSHVYAERFGTVRYAKRINSGKQKIRVFLDNSSLEIFCDEGMTVFTSRVFIDDLSTLMIQGVSGDIHYMSSLKYSENQIAA